jgi:hypothetical protein
MKLRSALTALLLAMVLGGPRKRRTMSAAARKRIAGAQRARWAKLKAARRGK